MKTVLPTRDVAHRWANQTQENARNGSNSVSFVGPVFRSYNTPIAAIVENAAGEKAFLLTTVSYSVTTSSKHMSAVWHAVYGRSEPMFRVAKVGRGGRSPGDFDVAEGMLDYATRIAEAEGAMKRSRKYKDNHAKRIAALTIEANAYARFFGLAEAYSEALTTRLVAEAQEAATRRTAERIERERAAQEQRAVDMAQTAAEWRAYERDIMPWYHSNHGDMLRMARNGLTVETSRGANVPTHHARRLFAAWMDGVDVAGLRVGVYTVTSATADMIRIGCHHIARREAELLANAQGWTNTTVAA